MRPHILWQNYREVDKWKRFATAYKQRIFRLEKLRSVSLLEDRAWIIRRCLVAENRRGTRRRLGLERSQFFRR